MLDNVEKTQTSLEYLPGDDLVGLKDYLRKFHDLLLTTPAPPSEFLKEIYIQGLPALGVAAPTYTLPFLPAHPLTYSGSSTSVAGGMPVD